MLNDKLLDQTLGLKFDMRHVGDRITLLYYAKTSPSTEIYTEDVVKGLKELRDSITFFLEDLHVANVAEKRGKK